MDYKHLYYKYKYKYITLRDGSQSDPQLYDQILNKDVRDIDSEITETTEDTFREELSLDNISEIRTDETEETEVGIVKVIKGKAVKSYNIEQDQFISLQDGPDKAKILSINTLDDFDNFTEKYAQIKDDNTLYINWDVLRTHYKGLYINTGLAEDRYKVAYYKDDTYKSWWETEFPFDDVLIFTEIHDKIITGKIIEEPFKGKIFNENDFTPEHFSDKFVKSPDYVKDKILVIKSYDVFDEFTNKYGRLHETKKNKKRYIRINWDQVAIDFKGFYLDKDSTITDRYNKAFYNGEKYTSWVKAENIQEGKIYIFS